MEALVSIIYHYLSDILEELHSCTFGADIIRYAASWVESVGKPKQNIGNQLEVGSSKIFQRDQTVVTERLHHLSEI